MQHKIILTRNEQCCSHNFLNACSFSPQYRIWCVVLFMRSWLMRTFRFHSPPFLSFLWCYALKYLQWFSIWQWKWLHTPLFTLVVWCVSICVNIYLAILTDLFFPSQSLPICLLLCFLLIHLLIFSSVSFGGSSCFHHYQSKRFFGILSMCMK